jgi:hypothetical protein
MSTAWQVPQLTSDRVLQQLLIVQTSGQAMAEALRQGMLLVLVAIFGFLGSYMGVIGVAVGVVVAKFIFCISMLRLALSISDIRFIELLKAMRTGTIGCIVMGLSVLTMEYLLRTHLSGVSHFIIIALFGLLVYLATVRVCLTSEDSKFVESVCGMLPLYLANVLLPISGVNTKRVVQKVDNEIAA